MIPSLYARYLDERTDDKIIETLRGFASYRRLPNNQMYIVDIYVLPEYRNTGVAASLANMICEKAKEVGCTELIGTVNPSCKKATESIMVLIAYGMKVSASTENCIIFKKEI